MLLVQLVLLVDLAHREVLDLKEKRENQEIEENL